jgi:hypothetical protein
VGVLSVEAPKKNLARQGRSRREIFVWKPRPEGRRKTEVPGKSAVDLLGW